MTQQCKYDEQLLDYVYGELSETEARRFTEHLHGCGACAAQVASFGRVRQEFKNRPPVEPAGESLQRMTALLMQAATESAAASSPAATGGGGKILQLRSRGLRRLFLHPAGGVMAVAAAALFWVVFRAQPGSQSDISSPTSFQAVPGAASVPVGAAPTPEPAVPSPVDSAEKKAQLAEGTTASPGGASPKLEQSAGDGLRAAGKGGERPKADPADDFGGLRARGPAKELDTVARRSVEENKPQAVPKQRELAQLLPPAAKPTPGGAAASAAPARGKPAYRADQQFETKSAGPPVVALADQAYGKAKKNAEIEAEPAAERPAEQWAQPPPPPPVQAAPASPPAREPARDEDDSVRAGIARTQEQRQQKIVEALANQEFGNLGAGAGASVAQSNEGRYAARYPASSATGKGDSSANSPGHPLAASESAPTPAATAPAANTLIRGGRDDSASPLTAVKEQLRRGQCTEANAALTKLEQSSPTLPGLADTRAEWQSTCAAQFYERRLANEAPEAAAPARASKLKYASPSPAPPAPLKSPPRKAAKPERSNAKAADAVR